MKYLLLLTALFMVSCEGPNDPEPLSRTSKNFKNPTTVGTLPDGRVVKYIIRDRGSQHAHYIYFIDGVATLNTQVSQGKTSRPEVIVEIDGVKYIPVEEPQKKQLPKPPF